MAEADVHVGAQLLLQHPFGGEDVPLVFGEVIGRGGEDLDPVQSGVGASHHSGDLGGGVADDGELVHVALLWLGGRYPAVVIARASILLSAIILETRAMRTTR